MCGLGSTTSWLLPGDDQEVEKTENGARWKAPCFYCCGTPFASQASCPKCPTTSQSSSTTSWGSDISQTHEAITIHSVHRRDNGSFSLRQTPFDSLSYYLWTKWPWASCLSPHPPPLLSLCIYENSCLLCRIQ